MRWWKILGLAGLAGVAATGAVTVQAERRRRSYTPEEIRARLHERIAGTEETADPDGRTEGSADGSTDGRADGGTAGGRADRG